MAAPKGDKPLRRVARAVTTTDWGARAKQVAASLKAQHAAGRDGDDSPAEPVWPTPKQQLEGLKKLFRPGSPNDTSGGVDVPDEKLLDDDAAQVADALRRVDWVQVKAATAERTNDVARTMRSMADHVEWSKVQPVAAQVSSALIAAVAAGRIPLGGQLGSMVARAIADQNHLGRRVAANLAQTATNAPPDFRGVIEATATDS